VRHPESVNEEKFNDYLKLLQEILPSHDFSESKHSQFIHHKKICPPSEIDMFTLRGAKSIKQFHDEMG